MIWDVKEQGSKFPRSEYFICHRGNDHQEGALGWILNWICCHGFSVATQIESIFPEPPLPAPPPPRGPPANGWLGG